MFYMLIILFLENYYYTTDPFVQGEQMSSVTKYLMTLNMFSAFCLTEHAFIKSCWVGISKWKGMLLKNPQTWDWSEK